MSHKLILWIVGLLILMLALSGRIIRVEGAPLPHTATLSPLPPRAPSLQKFKYTCDNFNNTLSFNMIWNDIADNESGYRIIRDGWQAAELPAGSTTYTETISMPVSRSAEFYVQAYNEAGSTDGSFVKLICD